MNNKTQIIALTGLAGSGKDETTKYLQTILTNTTHTNTKHIAIADPLKHITKQLYPSIEDRLLWPQTPQDREDRETIKINGLSTTRELLLYIAKTLKQQHGDYLFVGLLNEHIKQSTNSTIIVSDVRYQMEADAIKHLGGIILHVNRPDGHTVIDDASENGISVNSIDYMIQNRGSIEDLHREIEHACQILRIV
ncbi:deoxynucleotide monophosphate kinase family protein [Shewanella algae]|uniref:deoxynucleotide monophosphate kinase family protein n=1 Tax=Shewanella algae TaxID=38313 RepID=UPI001BF170FA|nr:hypothetical protein [Shewanella algae]BCV28515.1 hypothetical protein TUM3811_23750 [Shewanella algae]